MFSRYPQAIPGFPLKFILLHRGRPNTIAKVSALFNPELYTGTNTQVLGALGVRVNKLAVRRSHETGGVWRARFD